jgi:hypothetical protein
MVRFQIACASLALLLAAAPAAAQCANNTRGVIEGLTLNADGTYRPLGAVRFKGGGTDRLALASREGFYRIDNLCPGKYSVEALDGTAVATLTLNERETLRAHIRLALLQPRDQNSSWYALVTILLFTLGLLLFRHNNIVRTNRELLVAQVDNLKERIWLEADKVNHEQETKALCDRAYNVRTDFITPYYPTEWFFWSRGRELAGWMRLHELERQVVSFLVPEQRVVERALYAETQLREVNTASAVAVANRIRQTLQDFAPAGSDADNHEQHGHALEHLKQQLGEGLAIVYDHTDTKFAGLMEWHNKAMFLVYLALLGIGVLSAVFHHEELFLIGAVGGLMSRMTRSLFREDVPNDYGASWTTLFLSPLLGAISAWVGITLIVWLREFNMLGPAFNAISWYRPTDAAMIAMAFTLGFSERLFTSLLSKIEGRVQDDLNRPPQTTTPVPLNLATGTGGTTGAGGAKLTGPGAGAGTPAQLRLDRIVKDLDLKNGERAGFMGDPASPARAALVTAVGAANLFDFTPATLAQASNLDGVLVETIPPLTEIAAFATNLAARLRADGRAVFVGKTSSALFEADAKTQKGQNQVGPAVIAEALAAAGITAQDPPEKLGGTDPVEWIASFIKPAPGGN